MVRQPVTPLRIAFCIDNMNVGGTELNAVRTARLLVERGVELRVFSLSGEGPLLEWYAEAHVPVHVLPMTRLYGRDAWRRGRELASLVREHGVQVVHAHDFYSNVFAAPWARVSGAAFIASRRWWEGSDRRLRRWANRCSYVLADRVLANSPGVADLLAGVERVRRSSVIMIPNFLDDAAFEPPPVGWRDRMAADLDLPADMLLVGSVASLSPIKDHATLLRAAAALMTRWSELHVVLVGADNGSRSGLELLAAQLGISDSVHFAGLRPSQPSAHHLFDISTLTSVSEGLPNSVLEAMAAARPVVATSVGAVPDAVIDGETGFLVPAGDDAALAARLAVLLADQELRRRMGEAGRQRAREQYSADTAVSRLLEVYQTIAPGQRTPHA
jgi:glycosyltransferase involved in cell wall biosynthesis